MREGREQGGRAGVRVRAWDRGFVAARRGLAGVCGGGRLDSTTTRGV